MSGSNYSIYLSQLGYHGALHLYANMFFMKIQEEKLDVVTAIMTQLSLKAVLLKSGELKPMILYTPI